MLCLLIFACSTLPHIVFLKFHFTFLFIHTLRNGLVLQGKFPIKPHLHTNPKSLGPEGVQISDKHEGILDSRSRVKPPLPLHVDYDLDSNLDLEPSISVNRAFIHITFYARITS